MKRMLLDIEREVGIREPLPCVLGHAREALAEGEGAETAH